MFEANSTKAIICDDAERELATLDERWRERLWNLVYSAFKQWKQEHGNREPRANLGMLSDLVTGPKPIPFDEAEPWQCAGFLTPCPTALAIKLWEDNYPPFSELTSAVGMRFVLAMLICRFKDSPQDCLFKAHRYMNQMVAMESIGMKLLDEHRTAIEAQKTRRPAGKGRGKQLEVQKDEKYKRIRDAEKALAPKTTPRALSKCIAIDTGLPIRYVEKARKELAKTGGS